VAPHYAVLYSTSTVLYLAVVTDTEFPLPIFKEPGIGLREELCGLHQPTKASAILLPVGQYVGLLTNSFLRLDALVCIPSYWIQRRCSRVLVRGGGKFELYCKRELGVVWYLALVR